MAFRLSIVLLVVGSFGGALASPGANNHAAQALAPRSSFADRQATRAQVIQLKKRSQFARRGGPSTIPTPNPEDIACPAPNVDGLDYITQVLVTHNVPRANHAAADLTWNPRMESYANQQAQSCNYRYSSAYGDGNYGQIITAGYAPGEIGDAINLIVEEEKFYPKPYGNDNPSLANFNQWGRFSQIVWKDTTGVGCATVYCANGLQNFENGGPNYYTVCDYFPPGNFVGQFSKVGAPLTCSEGLRDSS